MSDFSKLIIDSKEVDLSEDSKLPLNLKLRINSLDGDVAGSFAKSKIVLPATKVNKAVFTDNSVKDFTINNSSGVQYKGLARLVNTKGTDDCFRCVPFDYELELLLDSSTWIKELEGCLVSDLIDEVVTYISSTISLGTLSEPDIRNYGFGFIKYREWANTRTVSETNPTTGATENRVLETPSFFDTTPLYYIRPLIKEAFRKIGYTVKSEFIDSEFFKRLVLPLYLPEKLPQAYSDDYLNTSVITSQPVLIDNTFPGPGDLLPLDTITVAPNIGTPFNVTTFEYTVPTAGYYELCLKIQFDSTVTGTFSHILIATVPGVPNFGIGVGGLLNPFPFETGALKTDCTVAFFNAGDIISVQLLGNSSVPFNLEQSCLDIKGEAVVQDGTLLPLKYLTKDWKILDIMRDISELFGLEFITNSKCNEICIEPSDAYIYKQRGYIDSPMGGGQSDLPDVDELREGLISRTNIVDWSSKVDFSKDCIQINKDIKGRCCYSFKEEESDTLTFLNGVNSPSVYDACYDLRDETFDQSDSEIETSFFCKSLHVFDSLSRFPNESTDPSINTQISSTITPQMPLIYAQDFNYPLDPTATEEDKNECPCPRLYYFAGQRGGIDGYIEVLEFSGFPYKYPALFQVNYNDPTGLDPVLSFCNESIAGTTAAGLLERYHGKELARKRNKTYLSGYICLNSTELRNIDWGQRINIFGRLYILKEIEVANPLDNESVKVLLQLDDFATQDDFDRIKCSGLSGVVQAL